MAKRNRHREIQKYGSLQGVRSPIEAMRAEVNEADRALFGRLVLWTHNYVNGVYEHAGHDGKPQEKRFTEQLLWSQIVSEGRYERFPLMLSSSSRPGVLMRNKDYRTFGEYRRQLALGNSIRIETEGYPENASRCSSETLYFETNADGVLEKGRYIWIADADQERPAPDAEFMSLDEAHEATVSGRAALLLWKFRNLVIHSPEQLNLYGAWGNQAQVSPPEELVPIPETG